MKINKIKRILVPNKKINIFTIIVLIIGITVGSIFANIITLNDKNLVIEKIKLFIDNINTNNIDSLLTLKNSIGINLLYIILIWILGFTLIGIIINIILLFIKSFIIGFTLSSFIITYSYKGTILSLLYILFVSGLNIITILLITISSITISIKLIKTIISKNNNFNHSIKRYFIILLISIIISIISSLSESFLFPSFIKLIIKLFI